MKPHDFVICLRREILESNLAMYRRALESSASDDRRTSWPQMAELYRSLGDEGRLKLVSIIKQVMVDTLSNVLGILDGSTLLEAHRGCFHLTYENNPQELNGELQDLFLSIQEMERQRES